MLKKHCSDEELIALLDGELPKREQNQVEEHLSVCWKCRGRRAAFEEGIHRISAVMESPSYPDREWTNRASNRLRVAMASIEPGDSLSVRRPSIPFWRVRMPFAALIAASIALGVLLYSDWFLRDTRLETQKRIDQVVESDRGLGRSALHQVFRVALRQPDSIANARDLRVEVWSDPSTNRHALRWHDGAELVHAAWRSGTGEWGVSPGLTTDYRTAAPLPDVLEAKWTPEDAEAELLTWVGGRVWKPLTFSEDLRSFAGTPNTTLETISTDAGIVRLRATRRHLDVTTSWTVDVDRGTSRPNRQTIRWSRPGAEMEMEVFTERELIVAGLAIPPEVFEDPAAPAIGAEELTLTHIPIVEPILKSPLSLMADSIRAEYCLRHLPADWVAALEVVEEDGVVVVRGITETAAIRELVERELHAMDGIETDLRSVEEATPVDAATADELPVAAPAEEVSAPLEKELATYFADIATNRDEAARMLATFSRNAVQMSAKARAEAWQLWRLRERFPEEVLEGLSPQAALQLEAMREWHQDAMTESAMALQDLVWPVLHPLSASEEPEKESGAPDPVSIGQDAAEPADSLLDTTTVVSLDELSAALGAPPSAERSDLDAAEAIDRRIRALLAGGSLLDASAQTSVRKLLAALETLLPQQPAEAPEPESDSRNEANDTTGPHEP